MTPAFTPPVPALWSLIDALTGLLKNTTIAGPRVYSPRDWPTWDGASYPMLRVLPQTDDKVSIGRTVPEFTTTATIRVEGRTEAPGLADDIGAQNAEHALGQLHRQVLQAVVNEYGLTLQIQQFASVRSQFVFDASGAQHLACFAIDFALEYFEPADSFHPVAAAPLTSVGLHADLLDVFDPNGTYPQGPFPPDAIHPAPRTAGPDGRDEGALLIPLPDPE